MGNCISSQIAALTLSGSSQSRNVDHIRVTFTGSFYPLSPPRWATLPLTKIFMCLLRIVSVLAGSLVRSTCFNIGYVLPDLGLAILPRLFRSPGGVAPLINVYQVFRFVSCSVSGVLICALCAYHSLLDKSCVLSSRYVVFDPCSLPGTPESKKDSSFGQVFLCQELIRPQRHNLNFPCLQTFIGLPVSITALYQGAGAILFCIL